MVLMATHRVLNKTVRETATDEGLVFTELPRGDVDIADLTDDEIAVLEHALETGNAHEITKEND